MTESTYRLTVLPSCRPTVLPSDRPEYDVAIAGAGPAGAAAALRLARAGLRVIAFDRAAFPRDKACSEYMSPEGVRHLAKLGILEAAEAEGGFPVRGTRVHGPRGSSLTGLFALAGTPFRDTGLSIRRQQLDPALVAAARRAGAQVQERTAVTGVVREHDRIAGLQIREESGLTRSVRARLVIGADGLRSVTARAVGRRRHGSLRRYALVAHVADVLDLGDTAELHVSGTGYVGLNPVGGGLANVALVVPRNRLAALSGDPTTFFFAMLERSPGVRGRVLRHRLARRVLATGPFAAWTAPVTAPGALLTGDAADFFDPFTGEGICAALRGAELIEQAMVPCLAGTAPLDAGLGAYRAARRHAFAGKWAVERLIGYTMLLPGLFDRAVERLERRGLSHTLIGVTGAYLPARQVLNPRFLSQVML